VVRKSFIEDLARHDLALRIAQLRIRAFQDDCVKMVLILRAVDQSGRLPEVHPLG
jgi:hypothetical protein